MSAIKYYDTTSGTWKYISQGVKGDTGSAGIVAQATAPDTTDIVWMDTSASGVTGSVPSGGLNGQVLAKGSNTDYDVAWETVDGTGTVRNVTAVAPLTGGTISINGSIGIQDATTSQSGAVQLNDSTSSTSVTTAATANSVKVTYDLATTAINTANNASANVADKANADGSNITNLDGGTA